jgi:metallo-beta-lactamase class B
VDPRDPCPGTAAGDRPSAITRGVRLTGGLLLALLWGTAAAAQSSAVFREMNRPVEPFRIIGNVYHVGASDVTSFLIATPAGHILLDGGFAETAPQIEANLRALGFRLEDVRILLNSHAHLDHAGGLAELKRRSGARLHASEADSRLLRSGGRGDFHLGDDLPFPPVEVDLVLADGDVVELGGTVMRAHVTAGHTPGCTTWSTVVHEADSTHEVLFFCSLSAPGYQLVGNPRYPSIARDFERSFELLATLPCEVFLGSHGFTFSLEEKARRLASGETPNPFIDPEGCRSYLADAERAFRNTVRNQEQKAGGR